MDTDSSAAKTESVPLAASGNPLQPNYATENAAAAPQTLKNSSYGKNADVVGIIAIVLVAVLIIFVIGMVIYLATSSDDLSREYTVDLATSKFVVAVSYSYGKSDDHKKAGEHHDDETERDNNNHTEAGQLIGRHFDHGEYQWYESERHIVERAVGDAFCWEFSSHLPEHHRRPRALKCVARANKTNRSSLSTNNRNKVLLIDRISQYGPSIAPAFSQTRRS